MARLIFPREKMLTRGFSQSNDAAKGDGFQPSGSYALQGALLQAVEIGGVGDFSRAACGAGTDVDFSGRWIMERCFALDHSAGFVGDDGARLCADRLANVHGDG